MTKLYKEEKSTRGDVVCFGGCSFKITKFEPDSLRQVDLHDKLNPHHRIAIFLANETVRTTLNAMPESQKGSLPEHARKILKGISGERQRGW